MCAVLCTAIVADLDSRSLVPMGIHPGRLVRHAPATATCSTRCRRRRRARRWRGRGRGTQSMTKEQADDALVFATEMLESPRAVWCFWSAAGSSVKRNVAHLAMGAITPPDRVCSMRMTDRLAISPMTTMSASAASRHGALAAAARPPHAEQLARGGPWQPLSSAAGYVAVSGESPSFNHAGVGGRPPPPDAGVFADVLAAG